MINVKRLNSNIKASIAYIIGTIIGQGMTFLSIIVFTRLMDQDSYGRYSTYYAGISLFTVLIGANLFYSLNNAYIEIRKKFFEYRKSVLFLSLLICIFVSVGIIICCKMFKINISELIVICGILHSYSFFVVNYRIYSANMENDWIKKTLLLILPNTLQFFVVLGIFLFSSNYVYELRVLGSAIGVFIIALFNFVEIMRDNGKLINFHFWKYAIKISFPSIIMSISFMLMQQCDKIMISKLCNYEETAVYSVLFYLGYALIAVDQAIAPVRQAWIYKKLSVNDISEVKLIQKWYIYIFVLLSIALLFVGPYVIRFIVPAEYWRFEYVSSFVVGACMMVIYRFNTEILLYYKRNIELSISVLFCALLNIYLNDLYIRQYGAIAATYTTIVSYFLLFCITMCLCYFKHQLIYSIKSYLCFIIYCIIILFIYNFSLNYTVVRVTLIGTIFLFCLLWGIKNYRLIKPVVKNID